MLYKMKVTLNASKDGRNSSAVLEGVAGHRPHPTHSNEDGPAASSSYLSSCSALKCAAKSAMGLGFKRKRETRYEHRDDCQMPLLYTKRKDDRSFIKESSRVK